jgi:uncharacterized protein YjiS (DUF1127 family)
MSAHPTSASFVAQFSHAFGWPARALEARRARASLAELSERELRDIGGARDEYELSVARGARLVWALFSRRVTEKARAVEIADGPRKNFSCSFHVSPSPWSLFLGRNRPSRPCEARGDARHER